MKYFPLILVVVLFPIVIADSTLAFGVGPAFFAEDVAAVKVKIINKMDDFEMARFDGVKLALGPLGSHEHESSEINTKGQLGFCEFLESLPPGEYRLVMPILKVAAKVVIPPSPDSTVSMEITISKDGVSIQTSLIQQN